MLMCDGEGKQTWVLVLFFWRNEYPCFGQVEAVLAKIKLNGNLSEHFFEKFLNIVGIGFEELLDLDQMTDTTGGLGERRKPG